MLLMPKNKRHIRTMNVRHSAVWAAELTSKPGLNIKMSAVFEKEKLWSDFKSVLFNYLGEA